MNACRSPVHCIVPPHMLKKLLEHSDPKVQASGMRTLLLTADLRGFRRAIGPMAAQLATPTGGLRRTIYTAGGGSALPGTLICGEGGIGSTADKDAINAYNGLGDTYNFYKSAYGRDSIDNRGMRLDATVHYGNQYDNAFWNGTQMVFGDGDGTVFNDFTICTDVIGHELTHGITQHESGLLYNGQSGALNESMSDVFGSLIKQFKLRQSAASADWLIGDGLLVHGGALRSMKAPGTAYKSDPALGDDPQPADMSAYVTEDDDYGGVHLNSGIPNHAFYLAAIAIGGNAWEQAGKIWYTALPSLPEDATFQKAADVIYQAAVGLFGSNSMQADAVGNAWAQVGLAPAGTATPARTFAAAAADQSDDLFLALADRVADLVMERMASQLDGHRRRAKTTRGR